MHYIESSTASEGMQQQANVIYARHCCCLCIVCMLVHTHTDANKIMVIPDWFDTMKPMPPMSAAML
jgi:hypothetical protein